MGRWSNLAIVVASATTSVLLAELAVRWTFPDWAPRTGRITRFWRFDPRLGWAHVPGTEGRFRSFGFDAEVRINSDGFRGPEFAPRKSAGRTRVALLGDSYVWGFGVDQKEIVSERLASRCPGLEVLNLAVSGYSTDQELLLLRDAAPRLQANRVILVVASNDFEGNGRDREYIYYNKPFFELRDGALVPANQPVPEAGAALRLAAGLAQRSYLLTQTNRVAEGLLRLLTERQVAPDDGKVATTSAVRPPFPRTEAERVTVALVRAVADTAREAGAGFALVFADQQGARARELVAQLERPGIPVVYLDGHLPADRYVDLHLPGDFHWSAEGHALVADVLSAELGAVGFLPPGACSRAGR